jgi:hypothetical protein
MDFIRKVLEFFLKGGVEQHLIFGTASAIVGVLVITLDCIHYSVKGKSFLSLSYHGVRSLSVFILWGFGAGLVGLLGGAISIFQENLQACVSVGVGWPLIIPKLIESSTLKEETQPATKEGE